MRNGKGDPGQRLSEWLDKLERFDLPDWDSLPQLDLYMDQVILLLTRYLSPLERYGEEKAITASIINNYVRMKVMPPPVKKRYSRVHLAYLIIICTLKQSLSISCIQRMLPEDHGEEAARALYEAFVRQYRSSIRFLCALPIQGTCLEIRRDASLPLGGGGGFLAGRLYRFYPSAGGAAASAHGSGTRYDRHPHLRRPGGGGDIFTRPAYRQDPCAICPGGGDSL